MTNWRIPSDIPLPDGQHAGNVSIHPQGAPQQPAPVDTAPRPVAQIPTGALAELSLRDPGLPRADSAIGHAALNAPTFGYSNAPGQPAGVENSAHWAAPQSYPMLGWTSSLGKRQFDGRYAGSLADPPSKRPLLCSPHTPGNSRPLPPSLLLNTVAASSSGTVNTEGVEQLNKLLNLSPELMAHDDPLMRRPGEKMQPYARRLYSAFPELNLEQLSLFSGATEACLRQDPAFKTLPPELIQYQAALPRQPKEKSLVYARRLYSEFPELKLEQLSHLSGATEAHLRQEPAFKTLPPELIQYQAVLPRQPKEKSLVYARRLYSAFPELKFEQLSLLSGAKESDLRKEPAFKTLPPELIQHQAAFPRQPKENSIAYARRLYSAFPELNLKQLSHLSGATESDLRKEPAFKTLPPELIQYQAAFPRRPKENSIAYARRLYSAFPELNLKQLSHLSGATESNLRQEPAFKTLPLELIQHQAALPRRPKEKSIAYARRLYSAFPELNLKQLSLLSGATESDLRKEPAFKTLSLELIQYQAALPRRQKEKSIAYARRLYSAFPELKFEQLSLLSGAKESSLRACLEIQ